MDLVKGAKLLADLLEKRGAEPPAKPATPAVETGPPVFRWVGVAPPQTNKKKKEK